MAGTSWPSLVAGNRVVASELESKFDWLEGSLVPMSNGSSTDAVHSIGTSTARWTEGWFSAQVSCASITATTIISGTYRANTLAPSAPAADTIYRNNIIKAWLNWANTTTGAIINDDFNVSAITRTGSGAVDIAFATAVATNTYAIFGAAGGGGGGQNTIDMASMTTTGFRALVIDNANAFDEPSYSSVTIVGA